MVLVTVRVGKKGVTPELVDEIKCVLRKRKKIRVKMLKTSLEARDRDDVMEDIRSKTKARKASLRGRMITLEQ